MIGSCAACDVIGEVALFEGKTYCFDHFMGQVVEAVGQALGSHLHWRGMLIVATRELWTRLTLGPEIKRLRDRVARY